ncbi:TetR/AcrR family transcriptional regulator [Gordonia shandongensis]|uniref:TetR/AcrR family transcriptional regulator n=1 Tax=Gordonia shandongensis TaxID=376351 RepID=UPI0003F6E041|nr:TetR/AcrR family transcriptional regulator [Gordonia shandongensis]
MTDSSSNSSAPPPDAHGTRWGDREQRRLDILRAGEDLIVSGGYDALRMRDVAAGAGISLGTVYTYYSTKESLFIAVFAQRLDRMLPDLERAVAAAPTAAAAFIVTADAYRDGYATFGRQFDALSLVTDASAVQSDVAEHLRAATARMVTSLAGTLTRFGYRGDVAKAMTLLWSTMTGLANHYSSERREFLPVEWSAAVGFTAETLAESLGLT